MNGKIKGAYILALIWFWIFCAVVTILAWLMP